MSPAEESMPNRESLEFNALPLVEASIRIVPEAHIAWDLGAIVEISQRAEEFGWIPRSAQAIETSPGGGSPARHNFLAPDVWRLEQDSGEELLFQPNLFRSSWLKSIDTGSRGYVRFSNLLSNAEEALNWTEDALSASVSVKVVNMSYQNVVNIEDPTGFMRNYLSTAFHVPTILEAPILHNLTLVWQNSRKIDLRIQITRDPLNNCYIFETAGGFVANDPEHSWQSNLWAVHQELQDLMRKAISDKAKGEWGLQN